MAVPVMRGDQVDAVLTLSLEPDHFVRVLADAAHEPAWTLALSDRNGRLIARSREQDAFLGRTMPSRVEAVSRGGEGSSRVINLQNREVVRAFRRTALSGWLVAVFAPVSVIDISVRHQWLMLSLYSAVFILIAIPLIHTFASRITQSISEATDTARRVGEGEVVRPAVSPLLEANVLSQALSDASVELWQRNRELAASEVRFRTVFEHAAVGIANIALDGKLVAFNDRFAQLLRWSREDIAQKTEPELTHPDDREREAELITRLMSGELPHYALEKRMIAGEGEPVWVRLTSSLVRDADREPFHRIAVMEDITQMRRAREVSARLGAIVQSSADAILSMSPAGLIESWNPGAEQLFGFTPEEMLGTRITRLVPIGRRAEHEQKMSVLRTGKPVHAESVRRHKDGTLIDVHITAAPIMENGVLAAITETLEDIRERKLRERQIALLNREVMHRVKNSFAVIQSIANQTSRTTSTIDAFRTAFLGRLQALSAANDMLLQTNWGGSDLSELVERQLAPVMPFDVLQLKRTGPPATIPAAYSVPLGLALYELGTNSLKFGAWSNPGGEVTVSWSLSEAAVSRERKLLIEWREKGGPRAVAPTRRGFGTILIERGIPNAAVTLSFREEGLICLIEVPLPDVRPPAEAPDSVRAWEGLD